MQQPQISIFKKILTLLPQSGEFRRNPALAWKVILILLVCGLFGVLGVGYFTYYQSIKEEQIDRSATVPKSPLRSIDVKAVLESYQQKKEVFNRLLSHKPTFLSPLKGAVPPIKEGDSVAPIATTTASTTLVK